MATPAANGGPIKAEEAPTIKMDLADSGSTPPQDTEAFEEDYDLQIPSKDNAGSAWLIKIPKYLYEAWADIDDDAEIEIGKVRVYHPESGQSEHEQKVQIRLHDQERFQDVPKNYNVKLSAAPNSNLVVFSEKDLAGHHSGRGFGRSRFSRPSGTNKSDRYGGKAHPPRKTGGYRSAIPKQTALAPPILHEATATAVEDETYNALMAKRYKLTTQPKHATTILEGIDKTQHPGQNLGTFSSFTSAQRQTLGRGARKAAPREKAVRISENELLDQLHAAFAEFRYWGLRELRIRSRQPEVYIKSTLEKIAVLHRSGPFAMKYSLRQEYAALHNIDMLGAKEEAVKEEQMESEVGASGDMFDDDDGADFEDVEMEGGLGAT